MNVVGDAEAWPSDSLEARDDHRPLPLPIETQVNLTTIGSPACRNDINHLYQATTRAWFIEALGPAHRP